VKSPLSHAGLKQSYKETQNRVTETKTPTDGVQMTINFDLFGQEQEGVSHPLVFVLFLMPKDIVYHDLDIVVYLDEICV